MEQLYNDRNLNSNFFSLAFSKLVLNDIPDQKCNVIMEALQMLLSVFILVKSTKSTFDHFILLLKDSIKLPLSLAFEIIF